MTHRYFIFESFRQVYEHYIMKNHSHALKWFQKNSIERDSNRKVDPPTLKRREQSFITSYLNATEYKDIECHYLYDSDIIENFKHDSGIRRTQPKTFNQQSKLALECIGIKGHENCGSYKSWKMLHKDKFCRAL